MFQLSQLKVNDVEWDEIELLGKFHAYEMTSKYYVIHGIELDSSSINRKVKESQEVLSYGCNYFTFLSLFLMKSFSDPMLYAMLS